MSKVDAWLEQQYDNRGRVPEHPQIIAQWTAESEHYRAECRTQGRAVFDLAYGPDPRHKLDLFGPDCDGTGSAPLLVFLHGGYWRALDRTPFSHMARGPNALGVQVAVPSYRLCPHVSLEQLIDDVRQTVVFLYQRYQRPMAIAGHSAGGHLTACLLGTDWPAYQAGLPARLTPHGYAISGLFDLAPLTQTSINEALRLSAADAKTLSPAFWTPPPATVLDAVVGSTESEDYHRQSRLITERWQAEGAQTRFELLAGDNHFTAILPLADPHSAMTQRVAALAKSAQA